MVYALRDKKVHAGVVRTDMLERMEAQQLVDLRTFRILNPKETPHFPFFHSTPLYPEWPLATMPGTPVELQHKVQQALVNMPKDHPAAQAGLYVGWTDAHNYQPVKQLMQELSVGPFTPPKKDSPNPGQWAILVIALLLVLLIIKKKTRQN